MATFPLEFDTTFGGEDVHIEPPSAELVIDALESSAETTEGVRLQPPSAELVIDVLESSVETTEGVRLQPPTAGVSMGTTETSVWVVDTLSAERTITLEGEWTLERQVEGEWVTTHTVEGSILMTKENQDIEIFQRESVVIPVPIETDGDELTASTASWLVTRTRRTDEPVIEPSSIETDGDTVTVTLESDDTDVPAGRYHHQLRVVDVDEEEQVVTTGTFTVKDSTV